MLSWGSPTGRRNNGRYAPMGLMIQSYSERLVSFGRGRVAANHAMAPSNTQIKRLLSRWFVMKSTSIASMKTAERMAKTVLHRYSHHLRWEMIRPVRLRFEEVIY